MSPFSPHRTRQTLAAIVLVVCAWTFTYSQDNYQVSHYTSKEGLPQNSIRGLAFDPHGFLWLATEGGIARFDGRTFLVIDEHIHPGIHNQRFTRALACSDTTILFTDLLNGIYLLANDTFSTLQSPDPKEKGFNNINGNPPDPAFLLEDTFFKEESDRLQKSGLPSITILPVNKNKVFVVSDRIILVDRQHHTRKIIDESITAGQQFASFHNRLIRFEVSAGLSQWDPQANSFKTCTLMDEFGQPWATPFKETSIYSHYPFEEVFINDGKHLLKLVATGDSTQYIIQTILEQIPENCITNTVIYQKANQVLALGTDSRGVFIYRPKHLSTFVFPAKEKSLSSSYYAQCVLDSSTILASNGLMIDIQTNAVKGVFPKHFTSYMLANDDHGNIYYARGKQVYRYSKNQLIEYPVRTSTEITAHSITRIADQIWLGTTAGIGYIRNDSMIWVYKTSLGSDNSGIKCMVADAQGDIWFGSYFQLYRLNRQTHHLDSFPQLANADNRTLALIRGKIFAGTYGNGFMVYDHDHFVHMPTGRNHELSTTHAFVQDKNGYLWITTNQGLYKTDLDAIDAFLRDTTIQLDYYVYLEEDGIQSTEFNGGCSPSFLWLPDGRLSLPTIEGLVMFRPEATSHYFPKDSLIFETIEVDGQRYMPGQKLNINASHSNIVIRFAGAWWNQPYNQYISYKLEGLHPAFLQSTITRKAYTIGHLPPGKYTFVLRRRSGFGPSDFIYSRLSFTVLKPWYAQTWAFIFYGIGFLCIVWTSSLFYARSIRQRNIELQKKVDEQTTELMKANAQLEVNLSKLALSENNLRKNIRVRDRLISIITHDILTPLRFIGQIARLGSEEKPDDEGLSKRALTDVQNAVHKLFHSTQNILHWVTYQQEQFKISSTNCSPFALVEQLMEDFSEMSRFQGNILVNEVPEDDVILTDPRILNIILHNLLSNAIKYTKNGFVHVKSLMVQNWYVLEVSDSGRGMTPVQLEAVRQGTTRQGEVSMESITAGTGIGLALVADLIQALNGKWEIDSPDTIGVRVRIFIPVEQPTAL